ncbi:MAG: hypothetical protein AAB268_11025 [Elusimicrobiota bacterium]
MPSAYLVLLLLMAEASNAEETSAECPQGAHRAATNSPNRPFECVDEDVKRGFGAVVGTKGFKTRLECPRGTRLIASSDGLLRHRCVRVPADETDAYLRYTASAEMSFEYPRMFQPRDGWKEEVPTLSFMLEDGSPGKPVMITITKVESSQPTFIDIQAAANKDKDWLGAKDEGLMSVAGVKARVTVVAGESKSAYIPLAADAYYAVVYSAPVESYDDYLGAFNRLLKTMKLTRQGK